MADAMVSARMSAEKKDAGNQILESLGTNASQAVNELYDFVIRNKRLPFAPKQELGLHKYTKEQIAEATRAVNSLVIHGVDPRLANMDLKEIKRMRLEEKCRMGLDA